MVNWLGFKGPLPAIVLLSSLVGHHPCSLLPGVMRSYDWHLTTMIGKVCLGEGEVGTLDREREEEEEAEWKHNDKKLKTR